MDTNLKYNTIPLSQVESPGREKVKCGSFEPCILCGKPIKNLERSFSVHLSTNCELVSTDQDLGKGLDQGFFPIGSECKKKLPPEFLFGNQ